MMRCRLRRIEFLLVAVYCVAGIGFASGGEEPADGKNDAAVAPLPHVDDVVGQLRFYAERLQESLAKADAYDESKQARVEKDAATVAALAGVLQRHCDDHALKPVAAHIRSAANEISANLRDYTKAAPANDRIAAALAGKATTDEKASAVEAASSPDAAKATADTNPMLMKQIRFIDNRMKRAARDRNASEKQRGEVAGHATTLAALAEAMAANSKHYGKTESRERQWNEACANMATAAAKLNAAARDSAANLSQAVRALDATCARCHADFR
jgi:hypothetical protein